MNAVNTVTRVVVCGAAALALTVASGWMIVESTAMAYWPEDMPTVVILAKAERSASVQLARSAAAGLLQ
jgi:Na+(H+)/acetate symporter ActP